MRFSFLPRAAALIAVCVLFAGCTQDMKDNSKLKPLEKSDFFADDRSSRPLVEDTVPRGALKRDELLYEGKINGVDADSYPFPVTRQVLERGRERFNIHCSVCHGFTGAGDGMVVQRGYKKPPSFHIDRLRAAKEGYFFNVITHGFATMPDYASQISPEDRWAIIAYVRALQLSQNAALNDAPAKERSELEKQ